MPVFCRTSTPSQLLMKLFSGARLEDFMSTMTTLLLVSAALLSLASFTSSDDARVEELGDGYMRVITKEYSLEVPKGWTVSKQTSYGERTIKGKSGSLGAMTAPPATDPWEKLYSTAIYYVRMETKDKPTDYKLTK